MNFYQTVGLIMAYRCIETLAAAVLYWIWP